MHEVVPLASADSMSTERAVRAITATSPVDAFTPETFRAGAYALPYRLPSEAPAGSRFPLVLILHGAGAMGTDNRAQIGVFAGAWARPDIRARFAGFIVVPQFDERSAVYTVDRRDSLPSSEGTARLDAALALVEHLVATRNVDPRRVYVVGFSMGGSAAWNALVRKPELFAGAVSIAGVPPTRALAGSLARMPILIVHGTADPQNPIAAARAMYDALRAAGSRTIRFRKYVGLDHRVPPEFVVDTTWRSWLFAQQRHGR